MFGYRKTTWVTLLYLQKADAYQIVRRAGLPIVLEAIRRKARRPIRLIYLHILVVFEVSVQRLHQG